MADVEITYKLIPTAESIEASAQKITGEINKGMGSVGVKGSKKIRNSFEQALDAFRTLNPRTYPTERFKAGGRIAGEASEGLLSKAVLPVLTAILGATLIVAAFFEAVGPIIKAAMKILTAVILILLMPFLKLFLPLLADMAKFFLDFAKLLAKVQEIILSPFEPVTGAIGAAFDIGSWILENINNIIVGVFDFGKWATEFWIDFISKDKFGVATWLTKNFLDFFNPTKFDTIAWINKNITNPLGTAIKGAIDGLVSLDMLTLFKYAIAKLAQYVYDIINGMISLLKDIKIPKLNYKWSNLGGFSVPTLNITWSSPFSGLSNISSAYVTSAINAVEKPMSQANTGRSGTVVNNTFNISGNVGSAEWFKQMADQISRLNAQSIRNVTSYTAGTGTK